MNRTEPNNLRLHYLSAAAKTRQKRDFHQSLLLWTWLFAVAATLAAAFASAL